MFKISNIDILILIGLLFIFVPLAGCEPEITPSEEGNPYVTNQSLELNKSLILNYLVLMPESFDSTLSYPVLLALPPGAQSINEVEWAVNLYYIRQSIQRNWIVISPIAPEGILFHEGSEVYIPMLLDEIEKSFHVEEGKYHIAGISNGGISAFRLATAYPERFKSVTVFPGIPLESDERYLNKMVDMAITLYVGQNDDPDWVNGTEQTAGILDSLGAEVVYKVWPANGHVITSLKPTDLFDLFDAYRMIDKIFATTGVKNENQGKR